MKLEKEQKILFTLLRSSIYDKKKDGFIEDVGDWTEKEWNSFFLCAENHAVLPMLYDVLAEYIIPETVWKQMENKTRQIVRQNYRLLLLNKTITEQLRDYGIQAISLKGAVMATRYPVPEYRKSGDVDLLVPSQEDFEKACHIMEEMGLYASREQHATHHIDYRTKGGISVELHREIADAFHNKKIDDYLRVLQDSYHRQIQENDYWGFSLYEFTDAYQAFYLLIHMLYHFLHEGFGIRNLCDWAVFFDGDISEQEKEQLLELLQKSGTEKFARVLTGICVDYLGLDADKVQFLRIQELSEETKDEVLQEILKAGDFGRQDDSRMVILENPSLFSYVKEFHKQMHHNFPKAGKVFLLWPALWSFTLYRFLHNNRVVRHTSLFSVLKNAGKRSDVLRDLDLFH